MTSTSSAPIPKGPGSVAGAPDLPPGFSSTFVGTHVDVGGIRLHTVIGGSGPPLLLVHGWPESWYAWRLVMPELAKSFRVIAVDQRGIGLSDKPKGGYDCGTLANDLVGLMSALGHERFAVVGHDTGFVIAYALAADHPERVERVALLEIPGPPLASASPPVFVPGAVNNRLWHIPFNRVEDLPEKLVQGNEDAFFRYELTHQGGTLPEDVIKYYVRQLSNPDSLRGSFGWYRALDETIAQNEKRKTRRLTMPVLAVGGETSYGPRVGQAMAPLAEDVQSVVIAGSGHWLAEQKPTELIAALHTFLAPYRAAAGSGTARATAAPER